MKKLRIEFWLYACMLLACTACNSSGDKKVVHQPEVLHQMQTYLTDIIVYDIFSPPVASRIYTYTSLAAYEAVRHMDTTEHSIVNRLYGFEQFPNPEPGKQYDFVLASAVAFNSVASQMIFSKDSLEKFSNILYKVHFAEVDEEVRKNSEQFGKKVAEAVLQRSKDDNYKQTRGLDKFYGSKAKGKWQPTAPDYLDATEPNWYKIKSFLADSSNQFDPGPPIPYDEQSGGEFHKMNEEVYNVGMKLTKEQKEIARFWDDNPFVMEHVGHVMAASKKQTPGGHWMGIATIACKKSGAGITKVARTYALTALALFEGFIYSFDTKYRYNYVRPITYINQKIDQNWEPFLQTPPFPEYTSGHSTITGSAAMVLTNLYGEQFSFVDSSNIRFINMKRTFNSFLQAADECSISRLYGGIHYRMSVDKGSEVGRKIGSFIWQKTNH